MSVEKVMIQLPVSVSIEVSFFKTGKVIYSESETIARHRIDGICMR